MGNNAQASDITTIAIGFQAGASNSGSVALGGKAEASREYSTAVGFASKVYGDRSTALEHSATTSNSYSIQLGNTSSLSSITAKVSITVTSDERDKADIEDLDNAMEFLRRVRAFRYMSTPI